MSGLDLHATSIPTSQVLRDFPLTQSGLRVCVDTSRLFVVTGEHVVCRLKIVAGLFQSQSSMQRERERGRERAIATVR